MTKQSLNALFQQQLAQLETLGSEQLNGLIHELERQKVKLPVKDREIIDWGISLVRARIREEKRFMCEMDEAWKRLRQKCSKNIARECGWNNLNLEKLEDKEELYNSGRTFLLSILQLSVKEGRIRHYEFEEAVTGVTRALCDLCKRKKNVSLYFELIQGYQNDFGRYSSSGEFVEHYNKLQEVLNRSSSGI